MNINELKIKPIWQMTGEEFLFLQHNGEQKIIANLPTINPTKKFVYGIRDIDFEPFAFRINENALPELVEDYQPKQNISQKGFDYQEVAEEKHREALENLF